MPRRTAADKTAKNELNKQDIITYTDFGVGDVIELPDSSWHISIEPFNDLLHLLAILKNPSEFSLQPNRSFHLRQTEIAIARGGGHGYDALKIPETVRLTSLLSIKKLHVRLQLSDGLTVDGVQPRYGNVVDLCGLLVDGNNSALDLPIVNKFKFCVSEKAKFLRIYKNPDAGRCNEKNFAQPKAKKTIAYRGGSSIRVIEPKAP